MSTASAPAAAAASTSATLAMPLSATATQRAGTARSMVQAAAVSIREGVEVAAVHAEDGGAGVERARHFVGRVDLDQRLEAAHRRAGEQRREPGLAQRPHDEQHRGRARRRAPRRSGARRE